MTVIARTECQQGHLVPSSFGNERWCRECDCFVNARRVEYVPAEQLRGAVEALTRIEGVYTRTMPGPRDALRDQVLEIIAAYRSAVGGGKAA